MKKRIGLWGICLMICGAAVFSPLFASAEEQVASELLMAPSEGISVTPSSETEQGTESEAVGNMFSKIMYLQTKKVIFVNDDGSYTVRMEAWAQETQDEVVPGAAAQAVEIDTAAGTVYWKEILSPYFSVLSGRIAVAVFDGAAFAAEEEADLEVIADEEGIQVHGFDFFENCICTEEKEDGTCGRGLVLEYRMQTKDGFLGGNGVPVSEAETGFYQGNAEDGAEAFYPQEQAFLDIPLPELRVTTREKNAYLGASLSCEDLLQGAEAVCLFSDGREKRLSFLAEDLGFEAWQTAFAEISYGIIGENGKKDWMDAGIGDLREDGRWQLEVRISPKYPGEVTEKTGNDTGYINIFQPCIHLYDGVVWYGEDAPTESFFAGLEHTKAVEQGQLEWKHEGVSASEVSMTGAAPMLECRFFVPEESIVGGVVSTKENIPVWTELWAEEKNLTEQVIFLHESCGYEKHEGCTGSYFFLHVKTCSLEISNKDGEPEEVCIFRIFRNGAAYMEIPVRCGDSVQVRELPVGRYEVYPDTAWSWRRNFYWEDGKNSILFSRNEASDGSLTCGSVIADSRWLNAFGGCSFCGYGAAAETAKCMEAESASDTPAPPQDTGAGTEKNVDADAVLTVFRRQEAAAETERMCGA